MNGETRRCHYCGCTGDLRPYGPGGALVCFPCGTATPKREAETEREFGRLLGIAEAKGTGAVVIGEASGPRAIVAPEPSDVG
jgi:hypothetical protein